MKKYINKYNRITHFFITAVETREDIFEDVIDWNRKSSRCWGYMATFKEAEEAVVKNYCDFYEAGMYNFIIIEEHLMDALALPTGNFQWYHWSKEKNGYEKCKQPEWAKNISNWGIG